MDEYIDFTPYDAGYWIIDTSRTNANAQCQIDYYLDGQINQIVNVGEFGYMYIKDDNHFDGAYIYCRGVYNTNEIVPSTVYFASNALLESLYTGLSALETFDTYVVDGDQIDAKITIAGDDANVIMVLAYDAGWNVKANGKQVKTFIANDGLLAFKLDAGTYEIKMSYTPPYFKLGLSLSLFGFVIGAINIFKTRKNKHEKR